MSDKLDERKKKQICRLVFGVIKASDNTRLRKRREDRQ